MQCPNCSNGVAPGARFCGMCGAPMPKSSPRQIVWIAAGAALSGVGTLLTWDPGQAYANSSYTPYKLTYSDGSIAQSDYLPSATVTYTGAENGLNGLTLLPLIVAAVIAVKFRTGPWPRWAGFTLAGCAALAALLGTTNGLFYQTAGPFLYLAGGLLMGWAAFNLIRKPAR